MLIDNSRSSLPNNLWIDGNKIKITGRSHSPNKLSIDHQKYLLENKSIPKNEKSPMKDGF